MLALIAFAAWFCWGRVAAIVGTIVVLGGQSTCLYYFYNFVFVSTLCARMVEISNQTRRTTLDKATNSRDGDYMHELCWDIDESTFTGCV